MMKKTIYVFDDNETTLEDFRDAASELGYRERLRLFSNEGDSLEQIRRFRRSDEEPIFVVDLNMDEHESGLKILAAIRKKDALKRAPVIIITSALEQETINRCYEKGANAFYRKHKSPEEFAKDIQVLMSFWSRTNVHNRCRKALP